MQRKKTARTATVIFAAGVAVLAFVITLIRAAHTEITYDESFTYLNYVRDLRFSGLPGLLFDTQTNNHPLNTVLIWMVQVVSNTYYDEFLIRLPNVLFYGIFLAVALYLLVLRRIPVWVYALLVWCYYLNELFGLARGYGMASCLVLLALAFYLRWREAEVGGHGWLTLSFAAFALGATAITYVMLVLLFFGLCALWRLLRQKQVLAYLKSQWLPLLPVAGVCVLVLCYQLISARNTGFSPGGFTGPTAFYLGFFEGFARAMVDRPVVITVLGFVLFFFFVGSCILFYQKLLNSRFVMPFLLLCGAWALIGNLGGAVPEGRGFLVFYPGMLFALWELAGWCREAFMQWVRPGFLRRWLAPAAGALTAGLAAVAFFLSINIHVTHEWADNYGIRERLYYVYANRLEAQSLVESEYNSVFFYREKILYEFGYDLFTGGMAE